MRGVGCCCFFAVGVWVLRGNRGFFVFLCVVYVFLGRVGFFGGSRVGEGVGGGSWFYFEVDANFRVD